MTDFSRASGGGVGVILNIRRQSCVPILVVCDHGADCARDYRSAGAAECIASPVDIVILNEVLQQIARVNRQVIIQPAREPDLLCFADVNFRPHQNLISGPDGGRKAHLTTTESRLLTHFARNRWETQTRVVLAEAIYGQHRPANDRAIDVVVTRLRTKLRAISESHHLIKTETGRGYRFVSDIAEAHERHL